MSTDTDVVFTGLELLLQLIDRLSAASSIVKQAHTENREPTSAELATVRAQADASIAALEAAIAQAKAEGR